MKKLIFFDIDGTLYNTKGVVPNSTKESIKTLQEAGHTVMIATGRTPFLFEKIRSELNIHSYVAMNGQYAVLDGKIIYKNPIPTESLKRLTERADRHNHPLLYLDEKCMTSNIDSHERIEEGLSSLQFTHRPKRDLEYYLNNDIYQGLLFCTEDESAPYIEEFTELDFIRWHPVSLDVMPKGGSKAKTIQKVIDILNFDADNIYAFGDGPNDKEMLALVKHSVAMGNAVEATKKEAAFITDHVDNDGIYKGLKHYGLVE